MSDVKAAAKAIRGGSPASVYLLYGTEKYQMKQFADLMKEQLIEEAHRDFAIATYDTADTPIEQVIEEAETVPFLVPRKLIFIRDHQLFTAGKDNSKMEHRMESLTSYLDNPAEYSILIFMVQGEKLDERKKIVKTMKSKATVLSFGALQGDELIGWIIKKAESQKVVIEKPAADALVSRAGTSLQTLSAEVDKLCLYAGSGGTVTVSDVEAMVARNTEQNIFAMIEEIARLRLSNALEIFYELLKQKEEPIKIMALIARQFRIILQVKELASQSYSQQQIASTLGLHPYAVKIAGEQSKKFQADRLRVILKHLAELDYQMKTGAIDKVLGLELFLLKLGA
ncbi:DNA polymerase III subunit delta [Paenibacillus urinalis]|uniref:DNA polymerase III subunit delta n=1 Tax=Paenibacillus urinalis TaxID=521520 RepID=A0AAX3MZ17_9BACL|nr:MULTISPECIES: DNA polymerase III subunit delta [Paenibacillus]WDH81607.1 DNA polymerase III subunit delta [Paenibacillus urinalis]WDH97650.1 DNA polymerase III subunit delta [Paenibacillus urinalis]WDI01324.1 DNA polymerase III subunit delta [Paenibacillus urinalis]GAK39606.1 DNA polymerase iii, delta subunit [Paenibacillus sp. TCA20]